MVVSKSKEIYKKSKYVTTHVFLSCISFILCFSCIVSILMYAFLYIFVSPYIIADHSDALCFKCSVYIFKFATHPFCLIFSMYAVHQGVICYVLVSKQHPIYTCLYFICVVLIIDLYIHKMHLCKLPKYANPMVCCIVFSQCS